MSHTLDSDQMSHKIGIQLPVFEPTETINNNNNNNNNSGHLIDALHKKYHSALQKGNKLHYFSCTNHNTSL